MTTQQVLMKLRGKKGLGEGDNSVNEIGLSLSVNDLELIDFKFVLPDFVVTISFLFLHQFFFFFKLPMAGVGI